MVYPLRVLRRENGWLLAERCDDPEGTIIPPFEITAEWPANHFRMSPSGDLEQWLYQNIGHP
jgi:hypothetical protein